MAEKLRLVATRSIDQFVLNFHIHTQIDNRYSGDSVTLLSFSQRGIAMRKRIPFYPSIFTARSCTGNESRMRNGKSHKLLLIDLKPYEYIWHTFPFSSPMRCKQFYSDTNKGFFFRVWMPTDLTRALGINRMFSKDTNGRAFSAKVF